MTCQSATQINTNTLNPDTSPFQNSVDPGQLAPEKANSKYIMTASSQSGNRKHVIQVAEDSYHFQLIRSNLNFTQRSGINGSVCVCVCVRACVCVCEHTPIDVKCQMYWTVTIA